MRVLWITNIVFPSIAEQLGMPKVVVGGWMYSAAKSLIEEDPTLQLAVATVYPGDTFVDQELDGIRYFILPLKGASNLKYNKSLEKYWRDINDAFAPDCVHLHGTEYAHGLAFLRACPNVRTVASIQGIVSSYARYYLAGLTTCDIIKSLTLRDVLRGTIWAGKRSFEKRGRLEIEIVNRLQHIIGRTSWDKAHVLAINACKKVFGDNVPQVAVFDTAFHQTMPAVAYMYAIPYEYYEKYGIRRYGAHGTSHRFVSARLAELMGKDIKDIRMITCHLGNGCSISAIKDGVCVDTSMGFTPLDGFMMGTRSGCIDPSVLTYIMEKDNISPAEMNNILNKKSGLLGVSGVSNDSRDVIAAKEEGNERAGLANEMQCYQISKFIGSYAAAMGGVDAIVFTGGIGENEKKVRKYICEQTGFLGFGFDEEANQVRGEEKRISTEGSKVEVWVVPTNEELLIARDTAEIAK